MASPLWARIIAILLFIAAAGGASMATLLWTRFGLRGLSPDDEWAVDLFAGACAGPALIGTVLGFLLLLLTAKPIVVQRPIFGLPREVRERERTS